MRYNSFIKIFTHLKIKLISLLILFYKVLTQVPSQDLNQVTIGSITPAMFFRGERIKGYFPIDISLLRV